jgi:hypothetical protein
MGVCGLAPAAFTGHDLGVGDRKEISLDDPSQIATLMCHVCGCPRAAVIDGTHIAAELP